MSISEEQWQAEQERVDSVTRKIRKEVAALEERTSGVRSDVVEIRKHFWDEVTINLSNAEDLIETYFSMKQQADIMNERERSHRHARMRLDKYKRLIQSPYFGRIDFREEGGKQVDQIYLGIASFIEEDGLDFLIYDWRAPISSLYYDYGPGAAQYDTPSGRIAGEMELKRQFVIRDGQIRFLFDTGITIGDELLQQALSRTADAQMRSIVATIQREQNQVIRNEQAKMLIVQGAAGSGKTSAALQRVAYLLYRHRETLKADQMVLFSPNPLFNSYVSTVLPELGEENMVQTTFQEYLESRLGSEFAVEDPFDQIEYVLAQEQAGGYEIRLEGIGYKSSAAFLHLLQSYVRKLGTEGMVFKPVRFRGYEVISAERLSQHFYSLDPAIRIPNRIELLKEWVLGELKSFEKLQRKQQWVEEEMELLSEEEYQRAYQRLRKSSRNEIETFDDLDQEKVILAGIIVQQQLSPVRTWVKCLEFVDVRKMYSLLFSQNGLAASLALLEEELPRTWTEIAGQTTAALADGCLSYEDATPYLYLTELLNGFRMNTHVRHVVIDEVQDYSAFQLEFMKHLFPRSRMTALGDFNQSIYAHTSVLGNLQPAADLFGGDQTEVIRLTRSYRSTKEIVEFTKCMVEGKDIIPFDRSGELPKVAVVDRNEWHDRIHEEIRQLQSEGYESIGLICKTAAESLNAYESLKERISLQLIKKGTGSFAKGAQVIPAYLAKGVEFDAVIVYDGSVACYARESERKLFYTVCTRAMHALRIFSIGTPSPFITSQPEECYVLVK
ncbi:RNA polymerase recycling motor HelD [Paenibacillus sp. GCM10012307]|uniref:UvrD-helicase domain-containing protein n=1 Tax=Paenibacillus roseus TaxID=2798579 RepID=A0A934JCI4_9BACL|nr:RNA polymerase recycling motor HelD [Paenibacillus roseus]MBJ6364288.1 UvrD-helicase domain-containing protein [Paenibacillus roseus]